jgi:hypothetical protein
MPELSWELTPENAPRLAAAAVSLVQEMEELRLDYSVDSLKVIDHIIGRFHDEGSKVEVVHGTLLLFGCYVGEVFVKNARASWCVATRDQYEKFFGVELILDQGNGNFANPLGKVVKRLQNGEVDQLAYFYHVTNKFTAHVAHMGKSASIFARIKSFLSRWNRN